MSHSKTQILSLQQYSHSIEKHRTPLQIITHRIGVIGKSNGAFWGFFCTSQEGNPSQFFFHTTFSIDLRTNMKQIHTSSNSYLCSVIIETGAIEQGPSHSTIHRQICNKIKIGESFIEGNRCPFFKIISTKHFLSFFLYWNTDCKRS